MRDDKPSDKAFRAGLRAVIVMETVLFLAWLYTMRYQSWYWPISLKTSYWSQYLFSDILTIAITVLWLWFAISIVRHVLADWPVTPQARARYDATHTDTTHQAGVIRALLKFGDDAAYLLRNKGSGTTASTLYGDLQGIDAAQDATPDKPANTGLEAPCASLSAIVTGGAENTALTVTDTVSGKTQHTKSEEEVNRMADVKTEITTAQAAFFAIVTSKAFWVSLAAALGFAATAITGIGNNQTVIIISTILAAISGAITAGVAAYEKAVTDAAAVVADKLTDIKAGGTD